jgi:predicted nucleic acid-binding protein
VWLVDTSAWVEFFRRPARLTLDDLVPDPDLIVTCLPVLQEVLQGFDDDRAYAIAWASMSAWPRVDDPLGAGAVERAVELYRQCRRSAITVRSSVDCLIAASALRHGLTVVHCDRDFDAIARVTGLRHLDLSPRLRRHKS